MAILPLLFLVTLLSFNLYANVFIYDADPLAGSSQFILILSGAFAAMIGMKYNVSYKEVINSISNSIKSVTPALIILLWVGALAGTWMISGIIPSMVYYGLKLLDPNIGDHIVLKTGRWQNMIGKITQACLRSSGFDNYF